MSSEAELAAVRVVCSDCSYSEVVENSGARSAEKIVEHGRETGHKLTTVAVEGDR